MKQSEFQELRNFIIVRQKNNFTELFEELLLEKKVNNTDLRKLIDISVIENRSIYEYLKTIKLDVKKSLDSDSNNCNESSSKQEIEQLSSKKLDKNSTIKPEESFSDLSSVTDIDVEMHEEYNKQQVKINKNNLSDMRIISGTVLRLNQIIYDLNNIFQDSQYIPLTYAARSGLLDVVLALVKKGTDINEQDKQGNTALHELLQFIIHDNRRINFIIMDDIIDLFKVLIDNGARTDICNNMNLTPLEYYQSHCGNCPKKYYVANPENTTIIDLLQNYQPGNYSEREKKRQKTGSIYLRK